MSVTLARIVRHPLKSIGREDLEAIELAKGAWMPMDRVWAVAHDRAKLTGDWAKKVNFLRGVTEPRLMAVTSVWNAKEKTLTLSHPEAGDLAFSPDDPGETPRLLDWLSRIWPADYPAPTGIYRAADGALTDVPGAWLSICSRASNRALSQRIGQELSPHRWRGNLWLDGLAPWQEKEWVGKDIRIGDVTFRVHQEITRCKATMANPDTGRRDADTLGALRDLGHQEFGLYAEVISGGTLTLGNSAEVPA